MNRCCNHYHGHGNGERVLSPKTRARHVDGRHARRQREDQDNEYDVAIWCAMGFSDSPDQS